MKSPVIAAWISGSRRTSAVGVFCEREEGARRSGLGSGRDVRCGFCARAVVMAAADEGGVMSFMSYDFHQSWNHEDVKISKMLRRFYDFEMFALLILLAATAKYNSLIRIFGTHS